MGTAEQGPCPAEVPAQPLLQLAWALGLPHPCWVLL